MRARPGWLSVSLLIVTVAGGLVVRFLPIGLPVACSKYGGSILWALLIYWIVSTLLPTRTFGSSALLTGSICTGIEFLKLYHAPALDAFRLTLPGILLLGRFFSVWDILAYWSASILGVLLDRALRRS